MYFYNVIAAGFHPIEWILGLFGKILWFFNSFTGSYLIAILIFAVLAKIIMFPLAIKQQKNSVKQAKLRPKEQAIRNKYKGRNDQVTQQKAQQEVQEMYQAEGYSPFGGCLPLLVQFPLIIGLYEIIRNPLTHICGVGADKLTEIADTIKEVVAGQEKFNSSDGLGFIEILKNRVNFDAVSEALGGAMGFKYEDMPDFSFFGIQRIDLAYTPINAFSDMSNWFYIIIPLLNFIVLFFSMKITKKLTYQPTQSADLGCSGKIMDYMMPLMSTGFAFVMPSLLGLYWVFNSIIGIAQSYLLKKMYPLPVFTPEEYKAAERELKGKKPTGIADDSRVVEGKTYVSLHHIDDDDYDEKGRPVVKQQKNDKPAGKAESAGEAKKSDAAPELKDDSDRRKR